MIKLSQYGINKKHMLIFDVACLLIWLSSLTQAASVFKLYLAPYFLVGIISVFGICTNAEEKITKKECNILFCLAVFFSTLVLLGNYSVFSLRDTAFSKAFNFLLLLLTGIPVFYKALLAAYVKFETVSLTAEDENADSKCKSLLYFFIPFGIILCIDLIYLFFAAYPGILTTDSIDQVGQTYSGVYSNHHPFFHTMLIKLFYSLGLWLFGNVNAAIATYCVFQVTVMSAIFAFAIYTLHQLKVKNSIVVFVLVGYAVIPYNYIYASTVWKDILFSGFCLLLITSLFRLRKNVGSKPLNAIFFGLASVGVCLFRSNGLFAFVFLFIALAVLFYKSNKIIPIIALCAIIVGVVLKGPVLSALDVAKPDTVESLSIPLQQIARTVRNGGKLTEEEIQYVDSILGMDAIPQNYWEYISDPIKNLARSKGANETIGQDKIKFVKVWLSIGVKNLDDYIYAWIDQTRGFWNSGYSYWIVGQGVYNNDIGLYSEIQSSVVLDLSKDFVDALSSGRALSLLVSTGLLTWIYLTLFVFNLMKRRTGFIETILGIAIILSLCVATPVFCEFRYAYGVYTMFPLAFIFALMDKSEFTIRKKVE